MSPYIYMMYYFITIIYKASRRTKDTVYDQSKVYLRLIGFIMM